MIDIDTIASGFLNGITALIYLIVSVIYLIHNYYEFSFVALLCFVLFLVRTILDYKYFKNNKNVKEDI